MPLGDLFNKDTHCSSDTVRPFPLIDALGKSNIYRNVMSWQPSIKPVITAPIQRRNRMMSTLWGGEGAQRHVNSCSEIVCRRSCLSCWSGLNTKMTDQKFDLQMVTQCRAKHWGDKHDSFVLLIKLSTFTIGLQFNQTGKDCKKDKNNRKLATFVECFLSVCKWI